MKKITGFIILIVLLFLISTGFYSSQLRAVSSNLETKDVVITKGQGLSEIASKLQNEGLIKSSFFFKIYVKNKGLGDKLQAGMFKLSPSMSVQQVIKVLTSGPEGVWVRLLEGWRVEEMAEEVNKQLNLDQKEFIKLSKEGYMFPDSYLFPREATVEYVVSTLKNTFESRFDSDLKAKIKTKGLTENEGVILASIVEREGRSQEVRRMIASILLKRLKINMGINADATIQYALGYQVSEKSWWKKHITYEDLKFESKYNTYIHAGLPPTPIANPSLSSLKAVAEADSSTPYLYYYHDSKGNSHYGKTLDEHNANVVNFP